jgi:AcrR family transcriptional regulator
MEGRRERKKRQTRQAISDAATRLFSQHGFEAVSLSQVAEAADVSVKTIFNHFGNKEDLFFDRAGELQSSIVRTISGRPPGVAALTALRTLLRDNWLPFPGASWATLTPEAFAGYRQFLATQEQSPALRSRRLVIERDLGVALSGTLAAAIGRPVEDATVTVLSAFVAATLQLRSHEFGAAALAGADPDGVRQRVTAVVDDAFLRLAAAYPELS